MLAARMSAMFVAHMSAMLFARASAKLVACTAALLPARASAKLAAHVDGLLARTCHGCVVSWASCVGVSEWLVVRSLV